MKSNSHLSPTATMSAATGSDRYLTFTHAAPKVGDRVGVKVRYRSEPVAADIVAVGDRWEFDFVEPHPRPAPGQSLVMYDGEFVLGGGIIIDERSSVTAGL